MLDQASNRGGSPDESKGRRREQQGELRDEYRRWCAFATRSSRGWGLQPESKLSSQSSSPPGDEAGTGHRACTAGSHVKTCLCCPASASQLKAEGGCRYQCSHFLLQLGGGWDGHFTFSQPGLDFCTARNIFPGRQLQSLLRSDRFKLRFVRQHPKV